MKQIEITYALTQYFHTSRLHGYQCYIFGRYESDFISVTSAGLIHEVEVKLSRGDFFADFRKGLKHTHIQHGDYANYFWFATPKGLIKPEEIPDYAGHLELEREDKPRYIKYIKAHAAKQAPRLHKRHDDHDQKIMRSMYFKQLTHIGKQARSEASEYKRT